MRSRAAASVNLAGARCQIRGLKLAQGFYHWVQRDQRGRRVAMYQAKTGKALGAKDRQLLPYQAVTIDQDGVDAAFIKACFACNAHASF